LALAGRLNTPKKKHGPNPPLKIESRVGIMAPPEPVWELLSNINAWPTWNPLYPAAAGELHIGAPLSLIIALPGEPHRQIEPRVNDWVPFEQILLTDLAWGGWVKSMRYIEIDHVDTHACIVSNGELFRGMVSEMYGNRNRRALKAGFAAMSEALKREAEKLWQAQRGAT
jgi:hypothetical protein